MKSITPPTKLLLFLLLVALLALLLIDQAESQPDTFAPQQPSTGGAATSVPAHFQTTTNNMYPVGHIDGNTNFLWSTVFSFTDKNLFVGPVTFTNAPTNLWATANTLMYNNGGQVATSLANGGANTFLQGTTPPSYTSIPDAALSANVALLNANNLFSGINTFSQFLVLSNGFQYAEVAWANAPTGAVDLNIARQFYNITNTAVSFTGVLHKSTTNAQPVTIKFYNASATNTTLTLTTQIADMNFVSQYTLTNGRVFIYSLEYDPFLQGTWTNGIGRGG